MTIVWVLYVAVALGTAVWAFHDAEQRGKSGWLAGLMVFLGFPAGLLVWLLFRPEK